MKEFNYTITDKEGIHMRPAGELVKAAKQFESSILIKKDGKTADCKKVFTIMSCPVMTWYTSQTGHIPTIPSLYLCHFFR